ncbi:FCD domain-containing protein [Pusillimonas sp. TS35]|uniref:GntR family transcriptional regulator n=1 Tax=Paracandidimonas lactea TaxID=2895524 RepID=UPI00136BB731|nr:GntR family transcriptional regulator [Paracandidimonas lactea]MYN12517.1 FCD domain-containing protein [Pusillimonas sp. TS35]
MLHLSSQRDVNGSLEAPKASSLRAAMETGERTDAHRVYDDIFDAVMDRRLLPGAKLTEAALCQIFSCSRNTVRTALAALAHDKIVNIEPNRGAFVSQPGAKETRDLFDMRRRMECMIIDMLLDLPDLPERLAPLYEMVARERQAFESGDRISWIRLSNAFHVELANLLGNDVLTETMHSLCARTTLIIALHDTPGDTACSYFEHEIILDHLSHADAQAAREAMHHHLADCEERMDPIPAKPTDPWLALNIKR